MIGQPEATRDGEGTPVHAVVQVGEEITGYVRAGRGRTVLLLGDGRPDGLPFRSLLDMLAEEFRVFAPADPRPRQGDRTGWLCGFLEGLGLERPALVVLGPVPWLEAFMRGHRDLVGPVVELSAWESDASLHGLRHLADRVSSLLRCAD